MSERLVQKITAIRRRIAKYGKCGSSCPCDYCQKNPATDLHEIINKGRVMGNPYARYLSEDLRICSMLCRDCHANKAPTNHGRTVLISRLYEIYGKSQVEEAFNLVPIEFRRGVELP